jgi:glycosyltransferase involved in cell wall biosynthesis
MPRVSVIIPAYNAAAFLPDALDSVLRQTYQDWEVILVDDGSSDHTRSLVESRMPSFDGRLKYVYQTNRGLPAARNTAIRNARGEFLALLDADDVWLEQRLELGVAELDRHPDAGLVHGKVARINVVGEFIKYPPCPPRRYLEGQIAHAIYTRRAHLLCPTILFRKACVDDVGLFDETMRSTEDRDLWFRIAERYQVRYIDQVIANYRISANSMSQNTERMMKWQTFFIEKHRKRGVRGVLLAREAIGWMFRERGDQEFNAGHLGQSLGWYFRSVKQYPFGLSNNYMLVRALAEPILSKFRTSPDPISEAPR